MSKLTEKVYKLDLVSTLASGTSSNFTTSFSPSLLFSGECDVALYSISMWNSLKNISDNLGNRTVKFSIDGTNFITTQLQAGIYSIEQLNLAIQALIVANGGLSNKIVLTPNYSTLKTDITIVAPYKLDLTVGNLRLLIGYNSVVLSAGSHVANELTDISNGVVSYSINSNIVSSESSFLNGSGSNSLFVFVPNSSAGELIQIQPNNLLWVKMSSKSISRLNITLTDQDGRQLVDLSDEAVRITLVIKEKL
jgi:hypothetical protein